MSDARRERTLAGEPHRDRGHTAVYGDAVDGLGLEFEFVRQAERGLADPFDPEQAIPKAALITH